MTGPGVPAPRGILQRRVVLLGNVFRPRTLIGDQLRPPGGPPDTLFSLPSDDIPARGDAGSSVLWVDEVSSHSGIEDTERKTPGIVHRR